MIHAAKIRYCVSSSTVTAIALVIGDGTYTTTKPAYGGNCSSWSEWEIPTNHIYSLLV